ncbi:hypothetical protein AcV7_009624 [Taiwanofungus camphoratus]|nr:hypothetical protein AcV7_009624 [Antrodia cinnamomea]
MPGRKSRSLGDGHGNPKPYSNEAGLLNDSDYGNRDPSEYQSAHDGGLRVKTPDTRERRLGLTAKGPDNCSLILSEAKVPVDTGLEVPT